MKKRRKKGVKFVMKKYKIRFVHMERERERMKKFVQKSEEESVGLLV